MRDPSKAVFERGLPPDGLSYEEAEEAASVNPEDVPAILDFLEQAGSGQPQPDPDDL